MNLGEIREELVEKTGRYDLVTDTTSYDDNGADFFIKAGQRYLDQQIDTAKSEARYQEDLSEGEFRVTLESMRSLSEVWITDGEGRSEVEKKQLSWLRRNYAKEFDEVTNGVPQYYAPAILRLGPSQSDLTDSSYTDEFTYDEQSIMFSDHYSYNGIILMPPVDNTYTVTLIGDFFSETLENDSDRSYWSAQYPDLLIYAAMYSIEKFYRNSQGVKDMKAIIDDELRGISHDYIAQDVAGTNGMKRSDL